MKLMIQLDLVGLPSFCLANFVPCVLRSIDKQSSRKIDSVLIVQVFYFARCNLLIFLIN